MSIAGYHISECAKIAPDHSALELVGLPPLMALTSGSGEIAIGVVDGPVAINHPDLDPALIRGLGANAGRHCAQPHGNACMHGTFVAGILAAKRGARAPAICPNCTLLEYPIFADTAGSGVQMPSATPEELATAVVACVAAGARLLNLRLWSCDHQLAASALCKTRWTLRPSVA